MRTILFIASLLILQTAEAAKNFHQIKTREPNDTEASKFLKPSLSEDAEIISRAVLEEYKKEINLCAEKAIFIKVPAFEKKITLHFNFFDGGLTFYITPKASEPLLQDFYECLKARMATWNLPTPSRPGHFEVELQLTYPRKP